MNRRQIKQIAVFFKRTPEVVLAYLFGSAVSGKQHTGSDVDIAVLFLTLTVGGHFSPFSLTKILINKGIQRLPAQSLPKLCGQLFAVYPLYISYNA